MLNKTFVVGLNHHSSYADIRSAFSLNPEKQEIFYRKAEKKLLSSVCILNTCNRTEIYGFGDADTAMELYLNLVNGKPDDSKGLFKLSGREAVSHIFAVASGLDSQVIGDLEILGQFRQAFHSAKKHNALNGFFERLANFCIQAAREIRRDTNISSGTVSLSYAAIKYVKNHSPNTHPRLLIIGAGEFGRHIVSNAKDYLPAAEILLCNRTLAKAEALAEAFGCSVFAFDKLHEAVCAADVVITCVDDTGHYLLGKDNVPTEGKAKLFLDMSVPLCIHPEITAYAGHRLITLDEVSREVSSTFESRMEDIPRAKDILNRHISEFYAWVDVFEKSDSIHKWKNMLTEMSNSCPHLARLDNTEKKRIMGNSMADFAKYIRSQSGLPKDADSIIAHFLSKNPADFVCPKATGGIDTCNDHNCRECQKN